MRAKDQQIAALQRLYIAYLSDEDKKKWNKHHRKAQ